MKRCINLLAFLILALVSATISAQEPWPSREVTFVAPSSPGGATDLYARLIAQSLADELNQPFLVQNRPGANGIVGATMVAKSPPDGYTFMVSSSPALIINPSLYKNLPYDAERDFIQVAEGVVSRSVLIVHPSLSVRSLPELVAAAKRNPGTIAYGSPGTGSTPHLGILEFAEATGVKFLHIPYKGMAPAYPDLLSGTIKFMLPDIGTALRHISSGKVLALAVSERTSQLPGVPTFAEAGFPNLQAKDWGVAFSFSAPAGTPSAVVQGLSAEIHKAMRTRPLEDWMRKFVLFPVFDTPESFAAKARQQREKWAAFIRRHGIVQQ